MWNSRITFKELVSSEYRSALVFLCGMLVLVMGQLSTVAIIPELLKTQEQGVALLQLINTLPLMILVVMFPLGRVWMQSRSVQSNFRLVLLLFTVGSVVTGVTQDLGFILIGRILQAVSCSIFFPMIFPITTALVETKDIPKISDRRGILVDGAMIFVTILSSFSLFMGNWQFIEWVLSGTAILVLIASYQVDFELEATHFKIDWHEVALSLGGPVLLIWITSWGINDLPSWVNPLFGGFSLILLVGYIVYDLMAYYPLSKFRQLFNYQYFARLLTSAIGYSSLIVLITLGDLYLAQGLRYSTAVTALSLLPALGAFVLARRINLKIINRTSTAGLTKTGMTILMVGWSVLAIFASYLNLIGFIVVSVIIELGHGLIVRNAERYTVHALPKKSRQAATLFFQQTNIFLPTIVLAVLTVILQNNTELSMKNNYSLPGVLSSLSGYRAVFLTFLVVVVLSWAVTMFERGTFNLKNTFK